MKDRRVNIDYYHIVYHYYDQNGNLAEEGLYSIKPLLEIAKDTPVSQRIVNCRGEQARLQTIDKINDIWIMQFLRIRKDYTTGIARDDGSFTKMSLKADEGLGDSASALYDDKTCTLIFQRNRDSVAPSDVLEYLQKVAKDTGILLQPIILRKDLEKYDDDCVYRTLEIGFADLKNDVEIKTKIPGLLNIFNGLKDFEAVNAKVVITVGKAKKNKSLEKYFTKQAALDLERSSNVNMLRLHAKASVNDNVETIDLIQARLRDEFEIKYSREEEPSEIHKKVVEKIWASYNQMRPLIEKDIRRD